MTQTDIRGYSSLFRSAGGLAIALAFVVDIAISALALSFVVKRYTSPLAPDIGVLIAAAGCFVLIPLLSQLIWGGTIGQLIWRIRRLDPGRKPARTPTALLHSRLFQRESYTFDTIWIATLLTTLAVTGAIGGAWMFAHEQPEWFGFPSESWSVYAPPESEQENWLELPFYFAVSHWPKSFEGDTVLYDAPYEVGPPRRFLSGIRARWRMPEVSITLEGPHTPEPHTYPGELKRCLRLGLRSGNLGCLRIQNAAIARQLDRAQQIHPERITLRWFETEGKKVRGYVLLAITSKRIQERYVLITDQGTQQAIVLDRPPGKLGERASQLIRQVIRSTELSHDLKYPRTLASRRIGTIQPGELGLSKDNEISVPRLGEIQAILLSKASLDPSQPSVFIALAQSATLLARAGRKRLDPEWGAAARSLLKSSIGYVSDIAPRDTRLPDLENLWNEVKSD